MKGVFWLSSWRFLKDKRLVIVSDSGLFALLYFYCR
jgi:hypothetical protein